MDRRGRGAGHGRGGAGSAAAVHADARAGGTLRPASGAVVTDAAVADFARIVGRAPDERARLELEREFARARYVARYDSGAERWRGTRPRRLTFVVHAEQGRPLVLGRVLPEHHGTARPRALQYTVRLRVNGGPSRDFEVVGVVHEQGGPGVAYALPPGNWLVGVRGGPGEVVEAGFATDPPAWAPGTVTTRRPRNMGGC